MMHSTTKESGQKIGRPNKFHPSRECTACSKCGNLSALRWRHLTGFPEEILGVFKQKYGICQNDCLCNSCYIDLNKQKDGPPPEKKIKLSPCFFCNEISSHSVQAYDRDSLERFEFAPHKLNTSELESHCIENTNLCVDVCADHFVKRRDVRFENLRCAVPSCNANISDTTSRFSISNFQAIQEFYVNKGEEWFSSLKEDSKICNKCRQIFKKNSLDLHLTTGPTNKTTETDGHTVSLFSLISDLKSSIQQKNISTSKNIEQLALSESLLYLAFNLLSDSPVFLSEVFDYFKNTTIAHSGQSNNEYSLKSYQWLRCKIEIFFGSLIDFHVFKQNGSIDRKKGTLILRRNADLANILHEICYRKLQSNSCLPNSPNETDHLPTTENDDLNSAYHRVIVDMSSRYQAQAKKFKNALQDIDLSKINLMSITESIDPFLWNFHFLVSKSKNEWTNLKSFPVLDSITCSLQDRTSPHSQNRILRTLFSVCHTLYQVSNGECSNPLHIVLADTIDSYSGSSKLSSTLNSFGIVASKKKAKEHIHSIVTRKNLSKFIDDLNVDSFTIISVDNIDIGQPNASVSVGFQNRGIHATSYQAIQPKPKSLLYPNNDLTPTACDKTYHPFYTIDINEKDALDFLSAKIFKYILQKKAIENTDTLIPNLKCHLSKYHNSKTESANVAYLGILNEPCDNTETVRHVIEKIHDLFDFNSQNKYMVLVGDAKTYDLFNKIKSEYAEELNWIIPFPGDWHILKNTQPVLFKIYFEAGLREIAKITHKEDGLLTILQQCTNFRKTHTFLLHVWECFYHAQLNSFLEHRETNQPISNCIFSNEEIITKILEFTVKNKDLSFEKLDELSSDFYKGIQIHDLQHEFHIFTSKMCEIDDTFKFWHDFVHKHCFSYVALYLAFRSSNWNLRVAALKNLAPLYHAYDRHMYLRLIPKHLADIADMPRCILQHLQKGGFTATKTGNAWQELALDEAHESFINLDVKESVRRPSPELLDTMSVYLPYRASLQNNLNTQLAYHENNNQQPVTTNKGFSRSCMKQDQSICSEYLQKISETKVFDASLDINRGLVQLFTNMKAEGSVHYDLMNFYSLGVQSLEIYVKSRILKEPSVKVPVRKHVLKTFSPCVQKKKIKKNSESQEKLLYSRCIKKEMAFSMHTGQPLKKFHQYISLPRAICNVDGTMNHQDTKSNATKHLSSRYNDLVNEKLSENFNPEIVILEGMFIINSAPIKSHHKTFQDYILYLSRRWVHPHLKSGAKEIHIIFDRPGALQENNCSQTLKDLERSRRDDVKQIPKTIANLEISSELPKCKWTDFLRNRENKRNVIKLLAEHFLDAIKPNLTDQICVLNGCFDDGNCFGITGDSDVFQLQNLTSNHEETDTLIWLHVFQSKYKKILIFSPDTDILFIGLSFASEIKAKKEIYIQMNILGENQKFIHLNHLIDSMSRDPDLACISNAHMFKCLQILYICSGCDYISFFRGYGKAMFLSTFFQFSQFICGGQTFAPGFLYETMPSNKENGYLSFIRLIGCLYFKKNATEFLPEHSSAIAILKDLCEKNAHNSSRHLHEEWLSCIREKVQVRASYEDEVPPSASALHYHWLRSCLVSQMYDQANKNQIILPSFFNYGFQFENDKISPIWDNKEHIQSVENRVKWLLRGCKCKTGCTRNNCKCKKNKQLCGPGCACLNCQNCNSVNTCGEFEIEETASVSELNSDTDNSDNDEN